MVHDTFTFLVLGISIYCVISTVWSNPNTEEASIASLAQRLQEVEKIQRDYKELLEKQAKQIDELTNQISEMKKGNHFVTPVEQAEDSVSANNFSAEVNDFVAARDNYKVENKVAGTRTLRNTPGMVAFTAYLGLDVELSGPQVVIFDKIITNEGGAYNANSGIFTAPIDGVYMFSYTIGQRGIYQLGIDLVVNGQRLLTAVVEGNQDYQDLQGGNLVIKRLRKGDAVWARRRYGTHLEGGDFEPTTFSGVLLF